jgi:hypothetical protein
MGRLRIILNLVILAIGALIAWHEYHHPPAKPKPSSPTSPPPTAPPPRPEPEETSATRSAPAAPAEAPATADLPREGTGATGAAGETVSAAERAAAERISELTEVPAVPDNAVPGDGSRECPEAYPIKGNATSRIYHEPGRPSYDRTIPEYCFATVGAAEAAGFRAPRH